jgi:hypothetical protein
MVSVKKLVTVRCLDCENAIELTFRPVEGQILTCPFCEAELEVINEDPLELDFYFEDWLDDDEWEPSDELDEDEDDTWEEDDDF